MAQLQTLARKRRADPAIRFKLHPAQGERRASVLLTHGYAEHQERYAHVCEAWTRMGLAVATWDLRGHGDSEGPRGHVQRFEQYVGDLLELLDRLEQEPQWKGDSRPVLFGHSLGGLISFHAALAHPDRLRGLALTSPFFALAMRVPLYKRLPARLLSRLVPRLAMPSGLSGSDVTRNEPVARAYDSDPKVFKHATARWFTEIMRAQQQALERAPSYRLPLVALLAGDDRVANTQAARKVLARVSSSVRDTTVVEGAYHEVFNEPEGAQRWLELVAERVVGW